MPNKVYRTATVFVMQQIPNKYAVNVLFYYTPSLALRSFSLSVKLFVATYPGIGMILS